MVQYRPTQHVRQEHIQRNGGWKELAGQGQSFGACGRMENLEAFVPRKVADQPCIVRVILYDQQYVIANLEVAPVVFDSLRMVLDGAHAWSLQQRDGARIYFV